MPWAANIAAVRGVMSVKHVYLLLHEERTHKERRYSGQSITYYAWSQDHVIDFNNASIIGQGRKGSYHIRKFLESWHTRQRSMWTITLVHSQDKIPGSSPGRGHCVVFLGNFFTLTVPLSTQVYKWVPANLMLGITLWWTSIPSRGE